MPLFEGSIGGKRGWSSEALACFSWGIGSIPVLIREDYQMHAAPRTSCLAPHQS